jgi:class 3 adenylate cyclase
MEPRIQYAQTADGVSIAFWTLGEGTPLVCMPNVPWSHIQLEWQYPDWRRYYERLAEKRKLIRYDSRGSGLSDREVADYSLDAFVVDLEAVVQRLGLERFDLLAPFNGGPVAIAYAARHPERVSHLGLWCSWARFSDAYGPSQLQAFRALRGAGDWELYTETLAHATFGWSAGEEASRFAAFMRESATREAIGAVMAALTEADATPFLSQVSSPTLVLHRREVPNPGVAAAKGLAAGIPDARLVLLEGASIAPWVGDMEAVLQATDEFLGEGVESAAAPAEAAAPGGLRTVLFTDIVGHTAIMRRLGDEKGREVLREHERITREALKSHGGTEVKTMGDGFLASFSSVTRAVDCAIALQQAFARHNETAAEPVHIRVGLNAGEPIEEEGDIFGETVILAARVAARAEGGEILASLAVRELCAGKGFLFSDRGDVALRGFEDPVRLYEVRWGEPA